MRTRLFTMLLATTATAQDFIHYKFDSGCQTEVINYAIGPGAFPANGTLQTNTAAPFAPGLFGGALAGGNVASSLYNRVATGWIPQSQPMTGDITLAFFAREAVSPAGAVTFLLGCTSSFRMFTNGAATTGLILRNIVAVGGSPNSPDCELPAASFNFIAAAQAGWVHIALVIDAAAATADWYANGQPIHQQTGVGPGLINAPGQLQVGYYAAVNQSCYDLDEFVLANRAYSPTEVLLLSQTAHAGEADYTSGIAAQCGTGNVTLGSNGSGPSLGNSSYALRINTVQDSLWILLPGVTRCAYGGVIPLPFDPSGALPELAGCQVVADAITLLSGFAPAAVPIDIPLPIPANPIYFGAPLFFQTLSFDLSTFTASMSNGFSVGIGQ